MADNNSTDWYSSPVSASFTGIDVALDKGCTDAADCDDGDRCTLDECIGSQCVNTCTELVFADVFPQPAGDGAVEGLGDVLCVKDGAATDPSPQGCNDISPFTWQQFGDIFPCPNPDGAIEFLDVLGVEDAAAADAPCPDCVCP